MPAFCCVVGCAMRRGPESRSAGVGFYRIPVDRRRRRAWVRAISRDSWEPRSWDRVCGRHFVAGFPIDDPEDVDYRPTLHMTGLPNGMNASARSKRVRKCSYDIHMRDVVQVGITTQLTFLWTIECGDRDDCSERELGDLWKMNIFHILNKTDAIIYSKSPLFVVLNELPQVNVLYKNYMLIIRPRELDIIQCNK